ncbi:hypothetical protein CU254_23175 [Amycolatopsis sp. AA4]|uniref:hypothetical protein n=1 Tax=Actinomycetes TaxID=1760 RepID=UPI0001B54B2C|nr:MULTISPECIES: hypothetical protein [Actinomycetes]ATY13021.1 hypothetical protein CU254_23175 [Amycolatopsis sp. AA4]EFL08892.1 predicted protein [Streptomyces sp. AA4]
MPLTAPRVVDDAFYDELTIHTDDARGLVEVSGAHVPTVVIARSPDAPINRFVPIGSREPADLIMTVGEAVADLRPGKGKWTRGSYRVDLTADGKRYRFKPNSIATSQLIRDGKKVFEPSMDDEDGDFLVQWLVNRDDTEPADAAIGYALAVAFRTGAMSLFSMLLSGAEMAGPG